MMVSGQRFKLVRKSRGRKPYHALVIGPRGGVRSLGFFATEDDGEHALTLAIEAEICAPVPKKAGKKGKK